MNRPARILLVEVNEDGTVGGSHQYLYDLVRFLDNSRFTPVVLFYQDNRFARMLRDAGVRTLTWDEERKRERQPGARFRKVKQMVQLATGVGRRVALIRRERIDLLHMNNAPGIGYHDWLPAARVAGIPIVAQAHLQCAVPERPLWRKLMRSFDAVVAISREIERFLLSLGIPPERMVHIYDGIDADAVRARARTPAAEMRHALNIGELEVMVAMVGHLRPWKGQDVVLEALRLLAPNIRRTIKVVFVGGIGRGDESYAARLQQMTREWRLGETVSFLGERVDVPDLMHAADIVLHASTTPEPFGLVVVEAMALGKAVLAAGLGGPAEIITPGTGLLFDPTRPEELAERLTALASDAELRSELGKAARARATLFSMSANVPRIEGLYERLLKPATTSHPA